MMTIFNLSFVKTLIIVERWNISEDNRGWGRSDFRKRVVVYDVDVTRIDRDVFHFPWKVPIAAFH